MSNNRNEEANVFRIPDNVISSKRIFTFRRRNLIEGAIFSLVVIAIILHIPFVPRVKTIVTIVLSLVTMMINLRGIKGMSLTEFFAAIRYWTKNRSIYHLRSVNNATRKKKTNGKIAAQNESYAEKIVRFGKAKFKEIRNA